MKEKEEIFSVPLIHLHLIFKYVVNMIVGFLINRGILQS